MKKVIGGILAALVLVGAGILAFAPSAVATPNTWTISFPAPPSELKVLNDPQLIVCGKNYDRVCHDIETFVYDAECITYQVDYDNGSGYNSEDPTICQEVETSPPATTPTETPTTTPTPTETPVETPEPTTTPTPEPSPTPEPTVTPTPSPTPTTRPTLPPTPVTTPLPHVFPTPSAPTANPSTASETPAPPSGSDSPSAGSVSSPSQQPSTLADTGLAPAWLWKTAGVVLFLGIVFTVYFATRREDDQ